MRRSWFLVGLIGGLVLAGAYVGVLLDRHIAAAQAPAPPFDLADQSVIDDGRRLFGENCAHYCHGKDGAAGKAPKLRGRNLETDYVYGRITNGSPNGMPAFGSTLPQEKIWKLVAFVVSISKAEDK